MNHRNRGGIDRRTFVASLAGAAFGIASGRAPIASAGEVLYNGIRLADPWPPRRTALPPEPILPPYLLDPPSVIPIDVGRQLFVDDFLIERTNLERTFHHAAYYDKNPVLRPTTQWERLDEYAARTNTRSNPAAMVFSDGVFYDPSARLYKMWYMGGYIQNTCYAVSHDGLSWEKPVLDIYGATNIVMKGIRDSNTVWLDHAERDPTQRYKMAAYNGPHHTFDAWVSADGIHWTSIGESGTSGDRSTFFYNPFRKVWVFSLRGPQNLPMGRHRLYREADTFAHALRWKADEPVLWTRADAHDPRRSEYNVQTELYNLDCVAYESVLLGLFTIFRGEHEDREKPNDICVGFSRDGFHWYRPDRQAFIPVSNQVGDWNWANVQSAGGCCLVVGNRLHFYVSGRQGVPGSTDPGVCSTGLAMLRRDGFASMVHPSAEPVQRIDPSLPPGTLVTRPVRFNGQHLFVNADTSRGELRVEMLDDGGRVIAPFVAADCVPVREDSTCARVTWKSAQDLGRLSGERVRLRFTLRNGRLFAFWVSGSLSGASGGYVGAGGPGFRGAIDSGA